MSYLDDAEIASLAMRMIDRTLPKAEWTHAGHFAAALWLCRNRPDLTRPDAIRSLIRNYNDATGTPNTESAGYHHTITLASISAAGACLGHHAPDSPLCRVLDALLASDLGNPEWLLAYWRRETLFSSEARQAWCEPDLAPLPF